MVLYVKELWGVWITFCFTAQQLQNCGVWFSACLGFSGLCRYEFWICSLLGEVVLGFIEIEGYGKQSLTALCSAFVANEMQQFLGQRKNYSRTEDVFFLNSLFSWLPSLGSFSFSSLHHDYGGLQYTSCIHCLYSSINYIIYKIKNRELPLCRERLWMGPETRGVQ